MTPKVVKFTTFSGSAPSVPTVPPPLAPHRPPAENGEKFSPFSGSAATSKYVASLHGVNEKTVRRNAIKGGDQR